MSDLYAEFFEKMQKLKGDYYEAGLTPKEIYLCCMQSLAFSKFRFGEVDKVLTYAEMRKIEMEVAEWMVRPDVIKRLLELPRRFYS
jgi:hypothetical protein